MNPSATSCKGVNVFVAVQSLVHKYTAFSASFISVPCTTNPPMRVHSLLTRISSHYLFAPFSTSLSPSLSPSPSPPSL